MGGGGGGRESLQKRGMARVLDTRQAPPQKTGKDAVNPKAIHP